MTVKAVLFALLMTAGAETGLAAPVPDVPAPEPGHLVASPSDVNGAVTRQNFEARFEASAARLIAKAPGIKTDRYAAFDVAWPRDAEEWEKLNGYAVLLTGALSQDASELPLSKVYLTRADGSQLALRRIGSAKRQLSPSSQAGIVFGQNLEEDFYLLPVRALDRDVQLRCDFARNRLGFVLANSLVPPLNSASAQVPTEPPPLAAIKTLVAREYPDFDLTLGAAAQ